MDPVTRLEPLTPARAHHLFSLLRQANAADADALELDDTGHVLGTVSHNDTRAEHLLGDLDVHA